MSAPTNNQYIKCISSNHFNLKETDNQKFKNQQLIAYKQITNNESFYASFPIIQSPNKKWMRLDCWYSEEKCYNVGSSNKQKMWKIQRFCPELSVFLVIVLVQTVRNSLCSSCEWAIERSCQEGAGRNFQEEIQQSFWEVFAGHLQCCQYFNECRKELPGRNTPKFSGSVRGTHIFPFKDVNMPTHFHTCLFLVVVWKYESLSRPWANDCEDMKNSLDMLIIWVGHFVMM